MLFLYYIPFLVLLANDRLAREIIFRVAYNSASAAMAGSIKVADASAKTITMAIVGYVNKKKREQLSPCALPR